MHRGMTTTVIDNCLLTAPLADESPFVICFSAALKFKPKFMLKKLNLLNIVQLSIEDRVIRNKLLIILNECRIF